MTPPSDIVYQWLLEQGFVSNPEDSGVPTWPCYVSSLPEDDNTPTDAVCVYDTTPALDGRLQGTAEQIVHYGIQIKVRSLNYADGWGKSDSLAKALDAVKREAVQIESGVAYVLVAATRISGPLSIGTDPASAKLSRQFTINFTITVSTP